MPGGQREAARFEDPRSTVITNSFIFITSDDLNESVCIYTSCERDDDTVIDFSCFSLFFETVSATFSITSCKVFSLPVSVIVRFLLSNTVSVVSVVLISGLVSTMSKVLLRFRTIIAARITHIKHKIIIMYRFMIYPSCLTKR